jgi:hypothetical protein
MFLEAATEALRNKMYEFIFRVKYSWDPTTC